MEIKGRTRSELGVRAMKVSVHSIPTSFADGEVESLRQVTQVTGITLDYIGCRDFPELAANAMESCIRCEEEREHVVKSYDHRKPACVVVTYWVHR